MPRRPAKPQPLPGAYLGRTISFRLRRAGSGLSLTDFAVLTRCGSGPPLAAVVVRPDGGFVRTVRLTDTSVSVSGRFVGATRAKGIVHVENGDCASGRVPFSVRIS
jgi:hypothetical protein